jgi:uncharacterized membrane protein
MPKSEIFSGASHHISIGNRALRLYYGVFTNTVPWAFLVVCIYLSFRHPSVLENHILLKDTWGGGGFVEKATVAILLVGICYGVGALIIHRKKFNNRLLYLWTIGWCLALIYFAGEEASWGQWYFGWETPESVAVANKQQETNLHNMSSWLNEKPRMLVEFWIIIAGIILPLLFTVKPGKRSGHWMRWIYPGFFGFSAVICFCLLKAVGWIDSEAFIQLGNSELRELYIAYFLSLYLIWLYFALKRDESVPKTNGIAEKPEI